MLLTALIALSVCGAIVHQSSSVAASPINATSAPNAWSQAPINPAFIQYFIQQKARRGSGHERRDHSDVAKPAATIELHDSGEFDHRCTGCGAEFRVTATDQAEFF